MLVRFAYQYWFNGSNVYQHQRFPQASETERGGRAFDLKTHENNNNQWSRRKRRRLKHKQRIRRYNGDTDILDCVPLIDLSIADWHMSLSFLPFINLRFFFLDLLPTFDMSSEYIFSLRLTSNHLFPIESNLKFHLIKSLLYIFYWNFSVLFFFCFFLLNAEWMWAQHQSQSQSHFIWL